MPMNMCMRAHVSMCLRFRWLVRMRGFQLKNHNHKSGLPLTECLKQAATTQIITTKAA